MGPDSDPEIQIWLHLLQDGVVLERTLVLSCPRTTSSTARQYKLQPVLEALIRYINAEHDVQVLLEAVQALVDMTRDGGGMLDGFQHLTTTETDEDIFVHESDERYLLVKEDETTQPLSASEIQELIQHVSGEDDNS